MIHVLSVDLADVLEALFMKLKERKNKEIRIAIIGVGNCASSLIQGLEFYKDVTEKDDLIPGIMHNSLGGYLISDIKVVAAFDIDKYKVGDDLSNAIFSEPNCTKIFSDVPYQDVEVLKGIVLDGVAPHMKEYFIVDDKQEPVDIVKVLKDTKTDILINYLPVGSEKASKYYAQCAIDAGCGFVNCIPVFIASDKEWVDKFEKANLPIIGDDIKSLIGATITHRTLIQMIVERGAKIDSTYQLNIGGNTDFRNMIDQSRLKSKKISKTESVKSVIPNNAFVYAGPNGCIDCLNDNKICHLRINFKGFGNIDNSIDLKLSVEDSPNSAGIVVDAIRVAKLALDKKMLKAVSYASSYCMKHPLEQMNDSEARRKLDEAIAYWIG